MTRFLWVCLGGAAGTGVRYLVALGAARFLGATAVPYGTLAVNVVGCFLMSVVMTLATGVASFSPTLRFALATGFLGGLTTYSSFNFETTRLLQDRALGTGLLYFALTVGLCFAAGLLGFAVAERFVPPPTP